ncbi:hypothetical protein SCHIN_v1c08570 [Spiroplasma chinense]|uniref:Transmembrane protein n=1 Tax=Spiroplasma chinense TaxID=216932 RepID=A0A5B9Y7H8_9MOLU|nr:hypothetical protein [Spiroplasma chinense]QEH62052.1 hypothetical protein SCHIN_v1c08570 [Spiroplasma chinense]
MARMRRSRTRGPKLTDKIINGPIGNMYTKRFLKSKHVNMVSEGDFLARIRCLCSATYLIPIQGIWALFYVYARLVVGHSAGSAMVADLDEAWLIKDQLNVLNMLVVIQLYHIILMSTVMIVMLNMTMGKGTTVFTVIFNVLFLAEALFYGSFVFILDWAGILRKFKNLSEVAKMLKTQWLWIIAIIVAVRSFKPLIGMFKDINMWNREWIRVDRYRKTEDKENAFVFKTWVTPGEIWARKMLIIAGWFAIITASVFQLTDVFFNTQYTTMKYLILAFGYFVFLGAYAMPYNKISLIFYWTSQTFLLVLMIYGFVLVQDYAWVSPKNAYMYAYLALILPWWLSFKAAIRYTWTLKDREEIKAIVLNMFETEDEFEQYLDQKNEQQAEAATTI